MTHLPRRDVSWKFSTLLVATIALASPALAADDPNDPRPARAGGHRAQGGKSLLHNNVEVSGIVIAREETSVRPDRQG